MAVNPCGNKSSVSGGASNVTINNSTGGCGCGCGGSGSGSGSGSGGGGNPTDPPGWFGGGGKGSGGNNGGPGGSGTGGSGTGTGDDSSGSGSGGNPTDGDTLHVPPTCLKVDTVTHDFCSDGFEFAMTNIRTEIVAACTVGGYNSVKDKLVSVKLDIEGLGYLTGLSLLGDSLVTNNGRKLTIKDAIGETHNLDYRQDIMQAPLPLSPQFIMRKYDAYGIDIPMGEDGDPVYIDGQMAAPARWLWPCSDPAAPRDPAWLYMCVASFVTIPRALADYGFAFTPQDFSSLGIWDDAGIAINCHTDNITVFHAADGNIPADSLSWHTPAGATITMVKPTPKAYSGVTITGKCVSEGAMHHVDLYNNSTLLMTDFVTFNVDPTNIPANSSDPAHTPKTINVTGTFAIPAGILPRFVIYTSGGPADNPQYTWDLVGKFNA